jgi:hypothetical protein
MPRPIEQEQNPVLRRREQPNRRTRNLALRRWRARGSTEAVVFERARRLVQFLLCSGPLLSQENIASQQNCRNQDIPLLKN